VAAPLRIVVVEGTSAGEGRLCEALRGDRTVNPVHAADASRIDFVLDDAVDAIVLDLDTCGFDVSATLQAAATRVPAVPVIVATALADERLAVALREGASDYALGKADVVSAVRRACARRAAEQARRQRDKREASAAMLGHVAHEINNPLGILLGQADLLLEMVEEGPLRERARKVVQATERCAQMIKGFLLVARRQPLDRCPVDVGGLLRDTLDSQTSSLGDDGIDVDVHLETPLPVISGDRQQLRQVILSLVANAQEALRDTPRPRRLACRARVAQTSDALEIEIRDSGPGIPEALHARIFDPFFTVAPDARGPGLGLALVQSVIEAHGGTVGVTSHPGAGATFTVTLPVKVDEEATADVPSTGRAGAASASPGSDAGGAASAPATILLVEDKPEVAGMLTDMLSIDGHCVETAIDGRGALHKLDEAAYDLVLTDVRMPGLDGPGLYREIELRHPGLRGRVIFCTGEALGVETQTLLERLEAPVISKPFGVDELRRAIRRVLMA
jgi:two-component system NtrC family sensor kinase